MSSPETGAGRAERDLLTGFAAGRRCVELNSFLGGNSRDLAAVAQSLVCIDDFRARCDWGHIPLSLSVLDRFQENLRPYPEVVPVVAAPELAAGWFGEGSIGFILVNAGPDPERLARQVAQWRPKLDAAGHLAVFLADAEAWPAALDSIPPPGGSWRRQGRLAWIDSARPPSVSRPAPAVAGPSLRIFLGNAPWRRPGGYGVRAGSRWPHFESLSSDYMPFPFFLAYAAALLETAGHQVLVCDGIAERIPSEVFYSRAAAARPHLVLLEISTPSLASDLADLRRLKELLPRVPLAVAGIHQPLAAPEFLAAHPEIAFALPGEYELTLRDLAAALAAPSPGFADIPGLVYRDAAGRCVATGRRELIADLDRLPWPARHLFPMHRYHDVPGGMPLPSVQLWGSRGCSYHCSFCAWPQIIYGGHRYRARAAAAIADEVESLVRSGRCRSLYFDDDTFNLGRERLLEFCAELVRRDLRVPWAIMARADLMDRELLTAMKKAGLAAVKYGVESADLGILDRAGKQMDLATAVANIRLTRELGIKTHLTFCFGLPGEDRQTAARSIDLALALAPDSAQFSLATPFPGSEFHATMEATGKLVTDDYTRYDGYSRAVVRTDALTADELEGIRRQAVARWEAFRLRRRIRRRPLRYLLDGLRHPGALPEKLGRLLGRPSRPVP